MYSKVAAINLVLSRYTGRSSRRNWRLAENGDSRIPYIV